MSEPFDCLPLINVSHVARRLKIHYQPNGYDPLVTWVDQVRRDNLLHQRLPPQPTHEDTVGSEPEE